MMKLVDLEGRRYRVWMWEGLPATVEVFLPAGQPRVMRKCINARWRRLNLDGATAKKVAAQL